MKILAVLVAALFVVVAVGPSFAQTQAPAPSKDTANSSAKVAPQADQGTGANPSKTKKKATASSQAPAPSKDTANPSAKKAKKKTASSQAPAPSKDTANPSAKTTPQADQGTGANPSAKKATTP